MTNNATCGLKTETLLLGNTQNCHINFNSTYCVPAATNLNRGHPQPAPRTQKGREVARSNLEAASVAENKHDLSRLERILMASRYVPW